MIVKMIGVVDGQTVIFNKDGGGRWTASIPKDMDGEYVIGVTAYDEAGNQAYATSMLFIVDPSTLQIKMIPLKYSYKINKKTYVAKPETSDFMFYEIGDKFAAKEMMQNFVAKAVI